MHVADLYRHVSAKHAIPANRKIGRGDLSLLDWAAFADEPGTHTLSLGHRTPLGSHPRKEDHKFLHSAAIIKHKGVMYRNCANSPSNENGPHKTLQGRRSNDDGKTWGPLEVIGSGFPGTDRHIHGILFRHPVKLWTICSRFATGDPAVRRFRGLRGEAFLLGEATDK
jgi:hypothetical protein